jgi:steroid delta-isomerase-like uncharacterized protein
MSTEEHQALARRWQTMWNENRPELAEACFAADCVAHSTLIDGTTTGTIRFTPELMRQYLAAWRAAFPDYHVTLEDVLTDGDQLVLNLTATATHQGPFQHLTWTIPPSGKRLDIRQIIINRVVEGKIAEFWTTWDSFSLLQQLGALPAPAQAT